VTVSDINAVISEIHIAAPPDVVFTYFVDPDKMRRWFGSRVQLEPRPGGQYAADINPRTRARGAYVEVVPPSRVVFTFGWEDDENVPPGSTTVEVTLTREGDGTHVRLVHRDLQTAEMRQQHRVGWEHYFARLGIAASGGDPGPDPNSNLPQGGA
jgi:uncharacterized protein YndB with AHSA1/START domain